VSKVGFFLDRCCDETERAWLAQMSLWDSFTPQQAQLGGPRGVAFLDALAARSVLQPAGEQRYRMHVLVRDAATVLLATRVGVADRWLYPWDPKASLDELLRTGKPEDLQAGDVQQLEEARELLLRAMAAVGAAATQATAEAESGGVRAAASVLQPDLGNCRRFCRIADNLVGEAVFITNVYSLFVKLNDCGMQAEAFAVTQQVSDW
jgi:hypothetical protein